MWRCTGVRQTYLASLKPWARTFHRSSLSLMGLFSVLSEIPDRFGSLTDCCFRQFLCICFLQPGMCDPKLSWCPINSQKQYKSCYEESNLCKNCFDREKGEKRQSKFSLALKNVFPRATIWKSCISAEPKPLQTSKSNLEISTDESLACCADRGPTSSLTTWFQQDTQESRIQPKMYFPLTV